MEPLKHSNEYRQSLFKSFNNAIKGVISAVKLERNMRIHLVFAVIALTTGVAFDLSRIEIILLVLTIGLVISLELINTSIEKTIDLVTREYHPLARVAKDIAAGAVFVASLNAVVVGWFLFGHRLIDLSKNPVRQILYAHPADITVISLLISFVVVIFLKGISGATSPLKGGWPSGHSALAFGMATAIYFYSESLMIIGLGLMLALLVGQSRVEGQIHNTAEVVAGAVIGIMVMALVVLVTHFWIG